MGASKEYDGAGLYLHKRKDGCAMDNVTRKQKAFILSKNQSQNDGFSRPYLPLSSRDA
ncbi:hypothetical protein [Bartonella harrusi]|uniref:Uncharacterized protein n=1 Tax=Bartonella harrusi TaxID=2961895 RepID=A0ABY5ERU1_9HYPH|nr:hypothetical protein [Bartonella harrusi]UTO28111.1 hypothetical protein NMK50_07925 [Bartonella harrusi]